MNIAVPEHHFELLEYFDAAHIEYTYGRGTRLWKVYEKLTAEEKTLLRLETCAQSFDMERYGEQKIRKGKSIRIGGGGHHRGQIPFQVWAVWNS